MAERKSLLVMDAEERRAYMKELGALGGAARAARAKQLDVDADRLGAQMEDIRGALEESDPDDPASNVLAILRRRCFEVLAELTYSPNENVRHKATTMILEYTDGKPVSGERDDGVREIVYLSGALAPDEPPDFVPAAA